MLKFDYVTTDDVHEELATRLARHFSATLCAARPRPGSGEEAPDALIYDLDGLPTPLQADVLAGLLAGPPRVPVAVHSYGLEDDRAAALRANGVAVYRRLAPEVLLDL